MLHFASVVAAVHQRYTPLLFLHFTWAFLCPVKLLGRTVHSASLWGNVEIRDFHYAFRGTRWNGTGAYFSLSLSRSSLHFFTTWPCSEPCFYYSSAWPPTATQQHRCLGNNTVRVCGNWLHTELLLLFYALRWWPRRLVTSSPVLGLPLLLLGSATNTPRPERCSLESFPNMRSITATGPVVALSSSSAVCSQWFPFLVVGLLLLPPHLLD